MKLDTPNRSVLALLAVPYLLLGLLNCGLLALVARRLAAGGLGALDDGGQDLRPALVVFALIGLGLVRAGWSLILQARAGRRLTERVGSLCLCLPADLRATAVRAGLADQVNLINESEPLSFTYGLVSPRVAVSRSLVATLSPDELTAVLEHEAYHVRSRDPLKIMLARAVAPGFFYLPALRSLRDRYTLGRELAADRRALRSCSRRSLAGAFHRVVPSSNWSNLAPAAGLASTEVLEVRLTQLETGREPALPGASRRSLAVTALAIGVMSSAQLMSVASIWGMGSADMMTYAPGELPGLRSLGVMAAVCPMLWAWFGWMGFRALFRVAAPEAGPVASSEVTAPSEGSSPLDRRP